MWPQWQAFVWNEGKRTLGWTYYSCHLCISNTICKLLQKKPHEHKNPTSISMVTAGGHTVKSQVIQSYILIMM